MFLFFLFNLLKKILLKRKVNTENEYCDKRQYVYYTHVIGAYFESELNQEKQGHITIAVL